MKTSIPDAAATASTAQRVPAEVGWHRWSLIWLGFLLLPLGRDVRGWLATAGAVVLFLPLHFWGARLQGPLLWLNRALVFALGVALFPFNAFAHTLFLYAGMPGYVGKARESISIMITVVLASYAYFAWHQLNGIYYGLVSVIVLGLGSAILAARANQETQQTIAGKDSQIERLAKRAERERIARDLHDLLGHTLSLIAIKAELAGKLASMRDERSISEISEIGRIARDALAQVRTAIAGIRRVGVMEALRSSQAMLEASGVETQVLCEPVPALNQSQETALAQALLEACTNIVRHADATSAAIGLQTDSNGVRMWIDDNGKGGLIQPGNGLRGMAERVKAVGGVMEFAELKPGMRLIVSLPRQPDSDAAQAAEGAA